MTSNPTTPYDWGIAQYNQLLADALAHQTSMFDYQQTLDTLKALRQVWIEGYQAGLSRGEETP